MEAHAGVQQRPGLLARAPAWLLGLVPLLLIVAALGGFAVLGGPGLGERPGPPAEELAIERTVLRPGIIELSIRNEGPDAVRIAQVMVNDAFAAFQGTTDIERRPASGKLTIDYPWIDGQAYEVALLTSTGGTIAHEIPVATETPSADFGFYRLMALLGLYVGIIPVALGMFWMPFLRRIGENWLRVLMALTIGLLAFLALDGTLEALELGGASEAFGGTALVGLGAGISYLVLAGVDAHLRSRRGAARDMGASGLHLALLIAIGIGLHNFGEGLAIGSAYAIGALALGAFLVVGFAIHNTTEGLAIVAPLANRAPSLRRLVLLGLVAGAPAIFGAWVGAAAFNPSVAALLLGAGVGAIVQVIQQLAPSIADEQGRRLHPASVAGILAGLGIMYLTSLLVSV